MRGLDSGGGGFVVERGSFGESVEHRVERGDEEEREDRRYGKAADDRAGERQVGLAAFADAERHGTSPSTVAMVVIRIGRSRVRPASIVASMIEMPRARSTLAKSTRSTPLDTTIPTIMMIPMKLLTESLVPETYSIRNTPEMPRGTLNMMTSGSTSDLNCDASTMYTSASAMSAAKMRPLKAFAARQTDHRVRQ